MNDKHLVSLAVLTAFFKFISFAPNFTQFSSTEFLSSHPAKAFLSSISPHKQDALDAYHSRPDNYDFIVKTLHTAFVVSCFLLNCVSDYRFNFSPKSCPINRASFLSTLSFWWYNSLISLGKSKSLQESDMWELNEEFQTRTVYNDYFKQYNKDFKKFKAAKAKAKIDEDRQMYLEKELDGELNRARSKKVKDINILGPFFRTFKTELIYAATYKLISILSGFAQPLILDLILRYIRSEDPIIWKGYFFAFGMFASSAIESILNNQYEICINEVAMKLKAAMTVTIYKKSLVLSASGRKVGGDKA